MSVNVMVTIIAMAIIAGAVSIMCIIRYLQSEEKITPEKANVVKEWLKYAVAIAERELGGGTGQLKLHMVYNMAIERFVFIESLLPFETFCAWVDEALIWLNNQIRTNDKAAAYITGEEKEG